MRRTRLAALLIGAASLSGVGVGVTTVFTASPASATVCHDLADNGGGNLGDPGNGGNHHNEDSGVGNHGDPGNAGNKACPNE